MSDVIANRVFVVNIDTLGNIGVAMNRAPKNLPFSKNKQSKKIENYSNLADNNPVQAIISALSVHNFGGTRTVGSENSRASLEMPEIQ